MAATAEPSPLLTTRFLSSWQGRHNHRDERIGERPPGGSAIIYLDDPPGSPTLRLVRDNLPGAAKGPAEGDMPGVGVWGARQSPRPRATKGRPVTTMVLPQRTLSLASRAGSRVTTWSYLFLKSRASLALSPAMASATGEDCSPMVDTPLKSTIYGT